MPQKDNGAGETDRADEVLQRVFPAYREAVQVPEPAKETFYLPMPPIAMQRASILRAVLTVPSMWGDHLDSGLGEFFIDPSES